MRIGSCLPAAVLMVVARTGYAQLPPLPAGETPDVVVQPPAAAPAAQTQRKVVVHVASSQPVDLQIRGPGDDDRYRSVCTSPCDVAVPAQGEYRIGAVGQDQPEGPSGDLRPSGTFSLPESAPRAVVDVAPRSQSGFVGGIVLGSVGVAALVIGYVWFLGNVVGATSNGSASVDITGPVVTMVGGGLATGGAVFLIVYNVRTRVSQHASVATLGAASPWAHLAMWREISPQERALPRAASAPLLRISF